MQGARSLHDINPLTLPDTDAQLKHYTVPPSTAAGTAHKASFLQRTRGALLTTTDRESPSHRPAQTCADIRSSEAVRTRRAPYAAPAAPFIPRRQPNSTSRLTPRSRPRPSRTALRANREPPPRGPPARAPQSAPKRDGPAPRRRYRHPPRAATPALPCAPARRAHSPAPLPDGSLSAPSGSPGRTSLVPSGTRRRERLRPSVRALRSRAVPSCAEPLPPPRPAPRTARVRGRPPPRPAPSSPDSQPAAFEAGTSHGSGTATPEPRTPELLRSPGGSAARLPQPPGRSPAQGQHRGPPLQGPRLSPPRVPRPPRDQDRLQPPLGVALGHRAARPGEARGKQGLPTSPLLPGTSATLQPLPCPMGTRQLPKGSFL